MSVYMAEDSYFDTYNTSFSKMNLKPHQFFIIMDLTFKPLRPSDMQDLNYMSVCLVNGFASKIVCFQSL